MCGNSARKSFGLLSRVALLGSVCFLACSPCFALLDWVGGGKSRQEDPPTFASGTEAKTAEEPTTELPEVESEQTETTGSGGQSKGFPETKPTDLVASFESLKASANRRGDIVITKEDYASLVADAKTAEAEGEVIRADRDDKTATIAVQKKEIDRFHLGLGIGGSYVPMDQLGVELYATLRKRDVIFIGGVEFFPAKDVSKASKDNFRYHAGLVWEF